MRGGGGKRRRDPGNPRRTQQRDRSAQQRERGAAPASAVADASSVRAAQREGRAGNRARRAPLGARGGGASTTRTTDESQWDETSERAPLRRRHPGRRRLPVDLPRERIEVVPPASERHCTSCDTAKVRIGADTTEELEQGVVQAVLPTRPIEKGRPGPGLLAHVVSSKYTDHLPLYRLEQIFER